jgi:type-2 restriction enzyme bsp6I
MKDYKVRLKDGTTVTGDDFDQNDFEQLKSIFKKWLDINGDLKSLKGRGLNVPDVFSEALFCIFFDAVRTNNDPGAHSYDCVIKSTGEGVQVKSASISNDLTSFGPTSTWDLLYFADFAPNGYVDGNVYFYKIDSDDVYNLILNEEKNETFSNQQAQGRRPRFSIKKRIIEEKQLKPVKKISLVD